MNSCPHSTTKTLEVRRTAKRGLRRRLVCSACGSRFTIHGGATLAELSKARATLQAKGYLR